MELVIILAAVFVYVTIVFVIALIKKRFDIVDIAWGGAFIVVALSSLALNPNRGGLQLYVTSLVIIWGVRLAYSIWRRLLRTSAEDPRYTELRSKWRGNVALNAYQRIFLTQGILAIIIASAVIVVNLSDIKTIGWLALVGGVVWLIGFVFEAIGDAQLKQHLSDPRKKGQLMTSGLWQYTRHPNYFGEATQWWGIWIIALSVPLGWVAIVSPLLITYLLLYVSGVPLVEKRFNGRPGWDGYKKRTNRFIPWIPKKA